MWRVSDGEKSRSALGNMGHSYCNVKAGGDVAGDSVSIPWARWDGASDGTETSFPSFTKPP